MPDAEMSWLWLIATIASEFHQLPSAVARDLENDPDRLSVEVLPLLRYADAKHAWDAAKGNSKKLEAWKDSKLMDQVRLNTNELHKERVRRMRAERERMLKAKAKGGKR